MMPARTIVSSATTWVLARDGADVELGAPARWEVRAGVSSWLICGAWACQGCKERPQPTRPDTRRCEWRAWGLGGRARLTGGAASRARLGHRSPVAPTRDEPGTQVSVPVDHWITLDKYGSRAACSPRPCRRPRI